MCISNCNTYYGKKEENVTLKTIMHSIRMRTARCSGRRQMSVPGSLSKGVWIQWQQECIPVWCVPPLQWPSLDVCLLQPFPPVDRQTLLKTLPSLRSVHNALVKKSLRSHPLFQGENLVMTKLIEVKLRKTADDDKMIFQPQNVCLFSIANLLDWSYPVQVGHG